MDPRAGLLSPPRANSRPVPGPVQPVGLRNQPGGGACLKSEGPDSGASYARRITQYQPVLGPLRLYYLGSSGGNCARRALADFGALASIARARRSSHAGSTCAASGIECHVANCFRDSRTESRALSPAPDRDSAPVVPASQHAASASISFSSSHTSSTQGLQKGAQPGQAGAAAC